MTEQRVFTVNLFFVGGRQLRLGYRSEDRARQTLEFIHQHCKGETPELLSIIDDFGTDLVVTASTLIEYAVLLDPVKEFELAVDLQLIQARAQHRMQERAQRDAVLSRSGPNLVVPPKGLVS